ncbi:barstar family protein [Oharaeibacter diazotrophicus]|uniref:Barstar (Barnase inhibitor) n=1 Tax=Oharaeibacter diazotrophicus TaxID=1920512 RepID=A0A4R6RLU9_9HYPH|nr:barstar family protein [Oharaeibacter diazotrophicus]TDP87524.1 barstar (barnase inhibitor) [Oharaeibacter diazotrophicus]BBE70532.1 barstar [Pleomorphomonas sp. SM30]GLS77278.1 hypothetical protein GCM10007904_26150 [Oharaeibacter diazotrophicus]
MAGRTDFVYSSQPESLLEDGDFVARIPSGLASKHELLETLSEVAAFPGYFGRNWDALVDCLRDFGWIENRRVVLVHDDLPLRNDPAECRTYIDVLKGVLEDWATNPEPGSFVSTPDWPNVARDLVVVFPPETMASIDFILKLIQRRRS